jgi:signal peptidase
VKRVFDRIVNIALGAILTVVLLASLLAFTSRGKGYSSLFGYAALAVRSESMVGENPDSFNKGDLIFIRVLDKEEKKAVSVGQVVTFYDLIDTDGDGTKEVQLNTHRITKVLSGGEYIATKGDNADAEDPQRSTDFVIGVYEGKLPWIGNVVLFIQSRWGFLLSIVLPSFVILFYCLNSFLYCYRDYSREKKAKYKSDMKELIFRELKSLGR